jgi:hypothetical protein
MENHLMKFKLCFQKCREYKIYYNLEEWAFMVFFKSDFRVRNFQGRKNTKPEEGSGNSKHANTYQSTLDLGF